MIQSSRLLLASCALLLAACGSSSAPAAASPSPSPSPVISTTPVAAVGDECLVRTWNLTLETISVGSGSTSVSMKGLSGTTLDINAGGTETINYDRSMPLVVTNTQNSTIQTLTYTGQVILHTHAADGTLTSTMVASTALLSIAQSGSPTSSPTPIYPDLTQASWPPATYTCTPLTLTMHQPSLLGTVDTAYAA